MGRLRHVELMNHLGRNLPHGPDLSIHQHNWSSDVCSSDLGLTIIWRANGKQRTNFLKRVRFSEQGAVIMTTHAFINGFRRRPQADYQRMGFQAVEVFLVRRQAASSGDDGLISQRQLLNDFSFPVPKGLFAVLLKNVVDGFTRPRLDDMISVKESKMQQISDQSADGGFARAHKSNQSQIPDRTLGGHCSYLTN